MTALAVVVLATLERVPALRFRAARLLRAHVATDVAYLLTGFVALGPLAVSWVRTGGGWLDARLGVATRVWPAIPFPIQVLGALVALDLGNYLVHWWLHRSDTLWEFHKAHHSSRHLDWLATFRSHVVEQLVRRTFAPLLLIVLGVPMDAVGVAAAVFYAWAMLNHANLSLPLGVLEYVLVTPRLHRLHHVPATTERNLGTVFTWWDRLRGTLVVAEPAADVRFGLPGETETYAQDWGRQLVAPFGRLTSAAPPPGAAAALDSRPPRRDRLLSGSAPSGSC